MWPDLPKFRHFHYFKWPNIEKWSTHPVTLAIMNIIIVWLEHSVKQIILMHRLSASNWIVGVEGKHHHADSVTRWLEYLFNIWAFAKIFMSPKAFKNYLIMLKILPNTIYMLSKCPKTIKKIPKWRNFAKSGHTSRWPPRPWRPEEPFSIISPEASRFLYSEWQYL